MGRERPDVEDHVMLLDGIIVKQPEFVGKMLRECMGFVSAGRVQPLPNTNFPITEVVDAFRFMAHAGHIGKIIAAHPFSEGAGSNEQPLMRADRIYLVSGGMGASACGSGGPAAYSRGPAAARRVRKSQSN